MDMTEIERLLVEQGKQIAELYMSMKSAFHRIDDQKALTETVHNIACSLRDVVNNQENADKAILHMQKDIAEIKAKPQKRWETVITALITAVVAFLAGRFLG